MWIFYITLIIFFLLLILTELIILSNLEIEIKDFSYNTEKKEIRKNMDYLIFIRLKLFNRITWIRLKINDKKINKFKESKLYIYKLSKIRNVYDRKIIKESARHLNDLRININKLNLYLDICALNNLLTSFSVGLISTFISIILAKNAKYKEYSKDKFKYIVIPSYEQKLRFKIKLDCIIDIRIVHIMNIIFKLIKKRSVVYNERTSNRRAYASINE